MSVPTLNYRRPSPEVPPASERPLATRVILSILVVLAWFALGAVTLVVAIGIARAVCPPAIMPAFIALLLIIVSLPYAGRAIRGRRSAGILGYLEQAMRLNLPLPQMLYAAQKSETGRIAARLDDLRTTLQAGTPLSQALARIPEVSDRTRGLLAAAERTGRLPAMLRRLLDEEEKQHQSDDLSNRIFASVYMSVYPIFALALISLLLIFVMPKFEQIFRDFKVSLPETTQWLIWLGRSEVTALAMAIVCAVCVMWIGAKLWELIVPRSIIGPWNWSQWLMWWMPVAGRAIEDRGLGDVFHVLAESTRAGYPLPAALAEITELRLNAAQGVQMRRWLKGVESGLPMSEAARRAGLPPLAVGLLSSAQQSGEAAEVFAFLSSYYTGRFSRMAVLLQSAFIPVMTLIFAAIVLFVMMSLFMPLITLTHAVTGVGRTL